MEASCPALFILRFFKKVLQKVLTNQTIYDNINHVATNTFGGVSEWFKELVLKTSDLARDQEFESLPLRHLTNNIICFYKFTHGEIPKW